MIKEYAYTPEHIEVLTDHQAMRKRPGMYVGSPHDGSGLRQVLWEVLDRAVEEHRRGFGQRVLIELHDDGAIAVTDEGRGMPTEVRNGKPLAEQIMATWRVETDDRPWSAFSVYPLGPCVASVLSERCRLEIWRGGQAWGQTYERGAPVTPLAVVDATTRSGTRITYWPDLTLFTEVTRLTPAMLRPRLRQLAALHPALTLELRHGGQTWTERRPTGISSLVADDCPDGLLPAVARFTGECPCLPVEPTIYNRHPHDVSGTVTVEVALQWRSEVPPEPEEASEDRPDAEAGATYLINGGRFLGGTPVRGLHAGLLQAVRRLGRERGLLPRRGWEALAASIQRRAVVAVRVEHPGPAFGARSRDTVVSPDVGALLRQLAAARVRSLLVEHPDVLARLLAPGG